VVENWTTLDPSARLTCYKGANVKNKQLVDLGKKIKALRKARKMSQETLAFDSNIDRSHISRIERGETNPTYLMLYAMAQAFGISVLEIFLIG
jgi:DNA-binding XRE family transcriptional regulator